VNWLDFVLIVILAGSIATSFVKGIAREVIGLAAAVAALLGGAWFYRIPGAMIRPYVGSREVSSLLGFLVIFAAVLIAGWLAGLLIGMMMKVTGLSWLDRLMGAGFGVARGVVISIALITVVVAFAPANSAKGAPPAVVGSRIAPYLIDTARVVTMATPRELREEFARKYEQIKRNWDDALKRGIRQAREAEL
jgi:membrane protein required for colicin V production